MTDTRADTEAHGQDAEFEAAFAERQSPAPARDEEPAEQGGGEAGADEAPADQSGADQAPAVQAKDPWEGASPELIAERDRLRKELDQVRHSDQSQRGRIAAMNRTIEQLRTSGQPQPQPQPDRDKPEGEGQDAKATREERRKQLMEDYPDVAGPMLELLDETRQQMEALGAQVGPVIEATSDAQVQQSLQALGQKHPDYAEVATSPDFAGWLASQPAKVQEFASSFDVAEVSAALTLFKAERDASKGGSGDPAPQVQQRDDRREKQLQGARGVASRPAPASAGVPDDFDAAFEHARRRKEAGRAR